MSDLVDMVNAAVSEHPFSGVVRVDDAARTTELAFGLADRAHQLPNSPDTRFATASGSKLFTALAVMSLVTDGTVELDASARHWLPDLTQLDNAVTVRQLLTHTSGVGEYLDDDAPSDTHLLPGSMHSYNRAEDFLALLDLPMKQPPGTFEYSNAGFVLLGIIAERASGQPFQDLIQQRVFRPAGLADTDFLRSDALPGSAAIGYLYRDGLRSNVFHLPIEGSPDGGAYTTAADLRRFWIALAAGRIVPDEVVTQMTTLGPDHDPDDPYGLGLWLPAPGAWQIVGEDAGVSMVSEHRPDQDLTMTVLANDAEGAWTIWPVLREATGTGQPG